MLSIVLELCPADCRIQPCKKAPHYRDEADRGLFVHPSSASGKAFSLVLFRYSFLFSPISSLVVSVETPMTLDQDQLRTKKQASLKQEKSKEGKLA